MSENTKYDLVVIGGGINGCGIARDAVLRGLRVALVEQRDIGSGTSAASSKLIHGGLRYLEHAEFSLVYESLHERRRLLELAPHLVQPQEFRIPIYADRGYSRWKIGAGLRLYDMLTGLQSRTPGHRSVSANELLSSTPALESQGLKGGFSYYDGSCTYPERLTLENALDAANEGADILTRHEVVGFILSGSRVAGVRVHDTDSDTEIELRAQVVINSAGPWVDELLGRIPGTDASRMSGTRGMHVLLPRREGGPDWGFYTPAKSDGRPYFVIPWRDYYWVGTTDIPHDNPDTVLPTQQEAEYLMMELGYLLPGLDYNIDDVLYAVSGVRPLPSHDTQKPGAITRRHIVLDHHREDGIDGLISIIGGKLTTYRSLAEEAVNRVATLIDRKISPSQTKQRPLPGSGTVDRPSQVDAGLWEHLTSIYGRRAVGISVLAQRDPSWAEPLGLDLPDIGAQVIWACRHELCKHVDDFMLRRSGIGTGHTEGLTCVDRVAELMASELDWSTEQRQAEIDTYRSILQREHRIHSDTAV
jgi:glycerol-3-phosphate dehydrogenase